MAISKGEKGEKGAPPQPPELDEERLTLLPDLFRRALTLGLSGIFTTETAFRRALGDTLPKDWVDFAVDQSERTREQFVDRLASELVAVIESMDLDAMLRKVLAEHRVEVKAEFKLVPEGPAGSAGGKRKRSTGVEVVVGGKPK